MILYSLAGEGLEGVSAFAAGLARALGAAPGELEIHRFPDGETRVRLCTGCTGQDVIFVLDGRDVNASALPLCFAAHAARAMGARRVGLVAPYLPYMRQDRAFNPGEAVSARAFAGFLSNCVDWVATVDPHLHRIHALDEVFAIPALCISSMPAISAWIAAHLTAPVIVGPDAESRPWVEAVAGALGVPSMVLVKNRAGDRQVSVSAPDAQLLRGRSPVILDDIASSGHTLAETAKALRGQGSLPVTCVVVHGLLADGAETALQAAGVERLVSTNTLAHATNGIDVIPIVARRIQAMLEGAGS